jgi:pilus assembly protein Flp/PilA
MLSIIKRFRRDERGATGVEYAMLIVFIALAIAVGASALGSGINTLFTNIGNEIGAVAPPPLPPVN